jgi:geranylgeranyl pyrophosphate synthase
MAVLAADGLQTDAFRVLAQSDLPAETVVQCVSLLSCSAGPWGMVGGQVLDMESETRACTDREVLDIQTRKTGGLFRAACGMGVLCGGGSPAQLQAALQYADALGLAFQIRDDILDYTATDALGKPTGMDLREKKITLPLLGALLAVSDERNRLVRKMVCEIETHPEYYDRIRDFVFQENGIAYAGTVLDEYIAKAKEALAAFPAGEPVQLLSALADFIGDRQV